MVNLVCTEFTRIILEVTMSNTCDIYADVQDKRYVSIWRLSPQDLQELFPTIRVRKAVEFCFPNNGKSLQ